jgi:asparagine N-glycosylation enzyme membrane subunit Stt3
VNAALNALQAWWQGGQLIEFIIALTVLEVCALLAYHRLTAKGLSPAHYALNLTAGLFLMLAVRSVLLGHHWLWTVLCLSSAGLAHWTDLWRRWQSQRQGINPS